MISTIFWDVTQFGLAEATSVSEECSVSNFTRSASEVGKKEDKNLLGTFFLA
jgi:hypothetical protein